MPFSCMKFQPIHIAHELSTHLATWSVLASIDIDGMQILVLHSKHEHAYPACFHGWSFEIGDEKLMGSYVTGPSLQISEATRAAVSMLA